MRTLRLMLGLLLATAVLGVVAQNADEADDPTADVPLDAAEPDAHDQQMPWGGGDPDAAADPAGPDDPATAPQTVTPAARWPVRVRNLGGTDLTGLPVLLDVPPGEVHELLRNGVAFGADQDPVEAVAAWRGCDPLVLLFPRLVAGADVQGFLCAPSAYLAPAAYIGPAVTFERPNENDFRVDNGVLRLEHDGSSGNCADRILVGEMRLGSYNPLICQASSEDLWTPAERFERVEFNLCAPCLQVDIVTSGGPDVRTIAAVQAKGQQAPPAPRATRFEVAHRLTFWPRSPCFAARLLWVRNADPTQALTLRGYYFQLLSSIGGSPKGDQPETVPGLSFHPHGVWRDATAGGRLGCVSSRRDVQVRFWLDSKGGQHPDARVELYPPRVLRPGETYTPAASPNVLVFGALDQAGHFESWATLEPALTAWSRLAVQTGAVQYGPGAQ